MMEGLPEDILRRVLSYLWRGEALNSCAQTCRWWHQVTRNASHGNFQQMTAELSLHELCLKSSSSCGSPILRCTIPLSVRPRSKRNQVRSNGGWKGDVAAFGTQGIVAVMSNVQGILQFNAKRGLSFHSLIPLASFKPTCIAWYKGHILVVGTRSGEILFVDAKSKRIVAQEGLAGGPEIYQDIEMERACTSLVVAENGDVYVASDIFAFKQGEQWDYPKVKKRELDLAGLESMEGGSFEERLRTAKDRALSLDCRGELHVVRVTQSTENVFTIVSVTPVKRHVLNRPCRLRFATIEPKVLLCSSFVSPSGLRGTERFDVKDNVWLARRGEQDPRIEDGDEGKMGGRVACRLLA